MRIIALDIATRTGWAFDDPADDGSDPSLRGAGIKHGCMKLPEPLGSSELGFDNGRVFTVFETWLVAQIQRCGAEILAFEAPLNLNHMIDQGDAHRRARLRTSENTVRLLFGLATIAELVATRMGLRRFEANNQEVRKHFLGSARGRSQELKDRVMARCRELGWHPDDHNAGDAIALHDYARHCFKLAPKRPAGPLFKEKVGW